MITKALVAILAGVTASLAVPLERQLALPIACANSVACLTFYSAESDLTILGWIPQSDNQAGKCVCSPNCVDSSANPCKSHVKAQIDVPDGKWVKHMAPVRALAQEPSAERSPCGSRCSRRAVAASGPSRCRFATGLDRVATTAGGV